MEIISGRQRDILNGFDIVWEGGYQNSPQFTLLEVAKDIPVQISFNKPTSGSQYSLRPSEVAPRVWNIKGRMSANTIDKLGMPTLRRINRMGEEVRYLSDEELDYLRRFGQAEAVSFRKLYRINLTIEEAQAAELLNALWQPFEVRRLGGTEVPPIQLDPDTNYRILPQKEKRPGYKQITSTLRVIRL